MSPRELMQPWLWMPLVLIVDFISKRLVLANLESLRPRIEILGDWVRLAYVRNPGAAMGLFPASSTPARIILAWGRSLDGGSASRT